MACSLVPANKTKTNQTHAQSKEYIDIIGLHAEERLDRAYTTLLISDLYREGWGDDFALTMNMNSKLIKKLLNAFN